MWIPSKLPGAEQTGGSLGGAQVAQGAAGCAVCLPVGRSGHPEAALLGRAGRGWPGEGRRVAQGCGGFSHPPAVPACMPLPPQGQSWALLWHFSGCCGGSVPLQWVLAPSSPLPAPGGTSFPREMPLFAFPPLAEAVQNLPACWLSLPAALEKTPGALLRNYAALAPNDS